MSFLQRFGMERIQNRGLRLHQVGDTDAAFG